MVKNRLLELLPWDGGKSHKNRYFTQAMQYLRRAAASACLLAHLYAFVLKRTMAQLSNEVFLSIFWRLERFLEYFENGQKSTFECFFWSAQSQKADLGHFLT